MINLILYSVNEVLELKKKYFLAGIISLILFGILLPQPVQALFVYSPMKSFFTNHSIILCVLVGIVQAVSEECGYYFVMKRIYNRENNSILPFWFGLGRGIVHTIFDIGSVILIMTSLISGISAVVSRLLGLGALIQLTNLDYIAFRNRKIGFIIMSVIFHFIMNSVIYANELDLLHLSDTIFIFVYSGVVIIFSSLLIKFNSVSDSKQL